MISEILVFLHFKNMPRGLIHHENLTPRLRHSNNSFSQEWNFNEELGSCSKEAQIKYNNEYWESQQEFTNIFRAPLTSSPSIKLYRLAYALKKEIKIHRCVLKIFSILAKICHFGIVSHLRMHQLKQYSIRSLNLFFYKLQSHDA